MKVEEDKLEEEVISSANEHLIIVKDSIDENENLTQSVNNKQNNFPKETKKRLKANSNYDMCIDNLLFNINYLFRK